jgi:hypothetical protein
MMIGLHSTTILSRRYFSSRARRWTLDAAANAEFLGTGIFWFVFGAVLWLWFRTEMRAVTRASLTSFLTIGYGLCKSYLRSRYPDPRQDPAGQGLGWAYPLLFWTAVSFVFAVWAAGLVIARFAELKFATRALGLAPLVLFFVALLLLWAGML